jgi:hypothetical protein
MTMTKVLTYALAGLLAAIALSSLVPGAAAASLAKCAFPNHSQCVCVVFDCTDTASGDGACLVSYSYDQDYWWGYGCGADVTDLLGEGRGGSDLPDLGGDSS